MSLDTETTDAPGGPPRELGHYVIEGELGRGGMGVVYLARDRKLDRLVAIKTLPAEVARDPDQLARFEREAKLLASLNHPNIATIHGLEETGDETRYLILERVEGETLADRVARGALPADDAARICEQVVDALEAAHERGVIHRDLKPGNVMITPGGRVKVLDFGLAKRTGVDDHADGEAGVIMGTPGYMSPEQVLTLPHDARTDVFALGCILFECLAGSKAFDAEQLPLLWGQVLNGEPDWNKLPKGVAAGYRHLIERCLEKDPDRRLGSMHDVRRGLRALLQEQVTGITTKLVATAGTLHNLPREVASFVGREQELEECNRLLGQTRLLTLTGPGGNGKTRLALKLVTSLLEKNTGGVWFVDLGPVAEAAQVPRALAPSLGGREESGQTLEESLTARFDSQPTLLMLDNCEHVLPACASLIDLLLQGCEKLKVVATSREALTMQGEQVYAVPTLAIPGPGFRGTAQRLAQFASARLFVERATQVQPAFVLDDKNAGSVAEICRRLDGIPLAIELAAARVKVLAVDQIRAKLDDRFRLLTGGSKAGLPRHQTLLATIQWSYDQLHVDEQRLLRALAVFAGGWTLEGATAVCGISDDEFEVLDLLTRLVDKSLVVVETPRGGASRYRYLETVRAYAHERLVQAQERSAVRDRHSTFYCTLAETAEPALRGPNQAEWLRQLNLENENLLAAISWREPPDGKPELALRIAGATWRYWLISGYLGLGRSLLQQLLQVAAAAPPDVRAKVLYGLAVLAFTQADYAAAKHGIEECLVLYREAGDLEREAACQGMLGNIAGEQGDITAAREHYAQALEICRKAGNQRGVATHLNNLGVLAWRQHDVEARKMFDEAAGVMRGLGDRNSLAIVLGNLANIATGQGDHPGARAYLVEGFKIIQELGSKRPSRLVLEVASDLADALGDPRRAVTLRGAADAVREAFHIPFGQAEKQAQEETVARLREKVGADFETAWEAGRVQDLDEALAAALAWLEGDGRATG